MLCLPPPYGLGDKSVHVSLRAPNEKHFEVRLVAVAMGCPVFIADRVEDCIRYSGRYDCLLNMSVDVGRLKVMMAIVGGEVAEIVQMDEDERLDAFTRRQPSLSIEVINSLDPFEFIFNNPYQGLAVDEVWRAEGMKEKIRKVQHVA